ncbi:MAG: phosphate ABC transporter permease subunit PstC [Halanaerobiales bacterium]
MIKYNLKNNFSDKAFYKTSKFFAVSILILIIVMLVSMFYFSWPAIKKFGLSFLVSMKWNPVLDDFGALPFIYGSLITSLISLVIAVPLGIGSAIFLTEIAPPKMSNPLSFIIELLAAVPSVIYGLWALFVLTPLIREYIQPFLSKYLGFLSFFQGPMQGVGILAAGIILAIMILPIITSISKDVLEAVPDEQKQAMLALGATRWETMKLIVLPYGKAGIIGGIILALGRAIGETMAVTMVIGNVNRISYSFFALGNTMSSVIANEFSEAVSDIHIGALVELGLILFVITLILNILARVLIFYTSNKLGR